MRKKREENKTIKSSRKVTISKIEWKSILSTSDLTRQCTAARRTKRSSPARRVAAKGYSMRYDDFHPGFIGEVEMKIGSLQSTRIRREKINEGWIG